MQGLEEVAMMGQDKAQDAGYTRHVAQVGDDPALRAFSQAARSRDLLPGWEFVSGIPNEPIPIEQAYRWSWVEVLRPMMVKAYDVVDPVKAERRNLVMMNPGLKRPATTQTLIAAIQGARSRPPIVTPPARSAS